MKDKNRITILIVVFHVVPLLALSIASLVIGIQQIGSSCDNRSALSFPTYLISYASVAFVLLLMYCAALNLNMCDNWWLDCTYITTMCIEFVFNIIWIIFGGVFVLGSASVCNTVFDILWAMMMFVFGLSIVGSVCLCWLAWK